MTAQQQHRRKRSRCTPPDADWESMFCEIEATPARGTITRVAHRHGVSRATLSRRWRLYQRAVHDNDVATQQAMLGIYERRRDNRRALSYFAERRAVDHLLLTNPAPSRADVSGALVQAHSALPIMQRITRSTPRYHRTYIASQSTVSRVMRQQHLIDKTTRLRRRTVRETTAEEKERQLDECLLYIDDVEQAFVKLGRRIMINVDETAVRTINKRRRALATGGGGDSCKPTVSVTRSDRESTSLICAVAAGWE